MNASRPPHHQAVPAKGLALLVVLTIVWGINWPLFRIALAEYSPWLFRTVTLVVAGGTLYAIGRFRGYSFAVPRRVRWRLVLAASCNISIWNMTTAYAVLNIPSGHAAVIGFSMPLWAAILGYAIYRERLGARQLVAVLLGAVGVTLLMIEDFDRLSSAPFGLALMLAAAIFWALGTQVQKRTDWGMPLLPLVVWQMAIGLVPILLVALVKDVPNFHTPSLLATGVTVFIGLGPMAVGMSSWFAIVRLLPTNVAALSTVLVPVVAVFSGALMLGEPLGLNQFAALFATVAALALVLIQPRAPAAAQA